MYVCGSQDRNTNLRVAFLFVKFTDDQKGELNLTGALEPALVAKIKAQTVGIKSTNNTPFSSEKEKEENKKKRSSSIHIDACI